MTFKPHSLIALVALFVLGFTVIPGANLLSGFRPNPTWDGFAKLYNADVLAGSIESLLIPFGISIKPNDLVIGKDKWLYLGDGYDNGITAFRQPATEEDRTFGSRVKSAQEAWQRYLGKHNVNLFKVLVGPNKISIYPEFTADWIKAGTPSISDTFLEAAGSRYVDVRPVLLEAKKTAQAPIYYRTDTHWNAVGASIAFKEFARQVALEAPDLRWPADELYRETGTSTQAGGDLSAFLYLSASMRDNKPRVALQDVDIPTSRIDLARGKELYAGPNVDIPNTDEPIIVQSKQALNHKKVLWLRDSFGTALSPFMSYTFSDVMHLHWKVGLRPGKLAELVDRWQPDYVFITVVEREARSDLFALPPPPDTEPDSASFTAELAAIQKRLHAVELVQSPIALRISDKDPYVVYALPEGHGAGADWYMKLSLDCERGFDGVPVQLFWTTRSSPKFDKAKSRRLVFNRDRPLLPLSQLGMGEVAPELSGLRVDLDDPEACANFRLAAPVLGRLP